MPDQAPDEAALFALAEQLQRAALEHGVTVAVAESCTGGLVGHAITEIPGSSAYFRGGIVSYSDDAKRDVLGVSSAVIAKHGAVSAQTAREMATGARVRLGADFGASITGVAGPGGGSDAKPVGLAYVGVADEAGVDVRRYVWPFDRGGNKRASAEAALRMLLERVGAASTER